MHFSFMSLQEKSKICISSSTRQLNIDFGLDAFTLNKCNFLCEEHEKTGSILNVK